MLNQPGAAAHLLAVSPNDPDGFAVVDEVDLRMRQQASLLSDVLRNGHLPLGRNAHALLLTITSKSNTKSCRKQSKQLRLQRFGFLAERGEEFLGRGADRRIFQPDGDADGGDGGAVA